MTEQLREKIIEIEELLILAYQARIDDCISSDELHLCIEDFTDQLLALVLKHLSELAKKAGYVKLADDQSLPPTYFANRKKMPWISDYDVEICAQADMLKAGWRKVIVEVKE